MVSNIRPSVPFAFALMLLSQTQATTINTENYIPCTNIEENINQYSDELLSSNYDYSSINQLYTIETNRKAEILEDFINKLILPMKNLDPDIETAINKNFMDLLT